MISYCENLIKADFEKALNNYDKTHDINDFVLNKGTVFLAKFCDVQNSIPYPLKKIFHLDNDCFYSIIISRTDIKQNISNLSKIDTLLQKDNYLVDLYIKSLVSKNIVAVNLNSKWEFDNILNIKNKEFQKKHINNFKTSFENKVLNNIELF